MVSCTFKLYFLIVVIVLIKSVANQEHHHYCRQTGPCTCVGTNYTIDFTSLPPDPLSATLPGNETIQYHPCKSFTVGEEHVDGTCSQNGGVAVCFEGEFKNETVSWGTHLSSEFHFNTSARKHELFYTDNNRVTYVLLNCIKENSELLVEDHNDTHLILMLNSPFACETPFTTTTTPTVSTIVPPTAEPSHGLSVGSILIIVFVVLASVYLFGGMLYRAFCLGAAGVEIIPNSEFWMDFPTLVKDGFVYLFTCHKKEARYDNI